MRILVTFAVEAEFAPWRRRHIFKPIEMPAPIEWDGHCSYRGLVAGANVDVLLTGIGWEENQTTRARVILRELLKCKPDVFVSSGLAVGLSSDLRVRDIVTASAVSLSTGGAVIHCSANLLALAEAAGAQVRRMQVTETRLVSQPSAKASLAASGDFVDMEGYFLLQIVSGANIPALSVRAISDARDDTLPAGIQNLIDHQGRVQALPLLKYLIQRPSQIPSLVVFGSKSKSAALALADFLDRFFQEVGGDSSEAQAKRERVAAG
jgi:nucleoside phosphorylase